MLKKLLKIFSLIFIGCAIGILTLSIFDYYDLIKPTFWDFSIIDLLSLIVYSLIAIYVAFYLQNRYSDLQIKKKLFLVVAGDIAKIFEDELSFLQEFMMANPKTEKEQIKVLLTLRKINNKIYILEQHKKGFNKHVEKLVGEIKSCYSEIKTIITGGDEFIKPKTFSEESINRVLKNGYDIISKLDQVKLSIFD
jgi:hypothetical protein